MAARVRYSLDTEADQTAVVQAGLDAAQQGEATYEDPNSAMLFHCAVLAALVATQVEPPRQVHRLALISETIAAMVPAFEPLTPN